MGCCISKNQSIYIVKENNKSIYFSYDLKKAEAFFDETKPLISNRILLEYKLTNGNTHILRMT
jgi:hypothetical protein